MGTSASSVRTTNLNQFMKQMLQEMSGGAFGNSSECGHAIHQGNRGETVHSGSAGVSPAVFGLRPKTPGGSAGDLVVPLFVHQSRSARRRPERPGRSRSPSESFQTVGVFCFLLLLGTIVHGQEIPADRVSVPFRDPSQPGVV